MPTLSAPRSAGEGNPSVKAGGMLEESIRLAAAQVWIGLVGGKILPTGCCQMHVSGFHPIVWLSGYPQVLSQDTLRFSVKVSDLTHPLHRSIPAPSRA